MPYTPKSTSRESTERRKEMEATTTYHIPPLYTPPTYQIHTQPTAPRKKKPIPRIATSHITPVALFHLTTPMSTTDTHTSPHPPISPGTDKRPSTPTHHAYKLRPTPLMNITLPHLNCSPQPPDNTPPQDTRESTPSTSETDEIHVYWKRQ